MCKVENKMNNIVNYDIQGFLNGKKESRVQTKLAKDLTTTFSGYKIDEFQINATIISQKEIDYFIKFLKVIRPCLSKSSRRLKLSYEK